MRVELPRRAPTITAPSVQKQRPKGGRAERWWGARGARASGQGAPS